MAQTHSQRTAELVLPQTSFRFGRFKLHPGRELLRDGVSIPIGRIALDLLGALVRARGDLVTKDELFDAAWPGVVVVENALHQHMHALRQALGDDAGLVATVARRGYRFLGRSEEIDGAQRGMPASMPSPLAPLIGRDAELLTIDELLGRQRCLTLLGPGGAGKTRLALEIARRWVGRGAAAARWVELAGITDSNGVDDAIAAAFGVTGLSGPTSLAPLARVQQLLRDTSALLVLDNCEHVVDACASAALALLQTNAGLRVLATSQCPLGISGEHRIRVSMLGLPSVGTQDPGDIAAAPAVQLLLARVGECGSQLSIDADGLRDAAALCRQLDGNALAIELASVHVAALGLAATRAALVDHFHLLTGGPREALPKHRSLDAMIDWSHALLSGEQAVVFRRLAVFAGGWTLDAARAVAGSAAQDGIDVASRLTELVERSLVASEGSTQSPRFRMLEAQRCFALEKLRASGESGPCLAAHGEYFAALFEASYREWDAMPDDRWLARYGPERDNLRAAIRCGLSGALPSLAARLVGSSIWLWRATGAVLELQQWLQHPALQAAAPWCGETRARLALAQAYSLHAMSSESFSVQAAAAHAVVTFNASPDMLGAANALLCLASAFAQLGDTLAHLACLAKIEVLLGEHRHGKTYAWYCGSHAWAAQLSGDLPAALNWVARSRDAFGGSGAWHGETRAMLHLADLQLAANDAEQAIATGRECLARLQGGLHRNDLGRALANLAAAWFARGDLDQAASHWEQALQELRGLDFSYWVFEHIALLAIAQGRDADAARMLGYADFRYAQLHKGKRVQNEQRAHDQAMAHLRSRYSVDALTQLLAAGADATEDNMATIALRPDPAPQS